MAINDLVNKMKLTLAAAVVAVGMSGCATPSRARNAGEPVGGSGGVSLYYAERGLQVPARGSNESESDYQHRMDQMRVQQSGMTWTSGGYVPQEDASFYSGMSQRDATRYGGHQQEASGYRPK